MFSRLLALNLALAGAVRGAIRPIGPVRLSSALAVPGLGAGPS